MPVYIAMLRGVNVAGHNLVKMQALRESLEGLGFEQVQTYLQSGNAVFKSPKRSAVEVSTTIQEMIRRDFGFSAPVISKTAEEMDKVIQNNPFLSEKGIDVSRLHVTFLNAPPAPAALKKVEALKASPDRYHHAGREIYLYCPGGYGNTKLSNNVFERLLGVCPTTRNWNTVNNLHQMAASCK